MREVKFKAWLTEAKVMLEAVAVYPSGNIGVDLDLLKGAVEAKGLLVGDGDIYIGAADEERAGDVVQTFLEGDDWAWFEKGFVILQFTGLKDKNGLEIYKGCIVYVPGIGNCTVVFSHAAWALENDKHLIFFNECEEELEVIGNIYENPELLTK